MGTVHPTRSDASMPLLGSLNQVTQGVSGDPLQVLDPAKSLTITQQVTFLMLGLSTMTKSPPFTNFW